MFTCKDYHLFIYSKAKRSIRAQNCWITPWWWITAIVHENVLLYAALGLWYPFLIFIYRWWLFRLGAIYCTASKLRWYIPEIMKIRKETNLLTWRYSTDSTGIRRRFSITTSTWLDLFQVPERMAWISKQPTMSCQRPFGSRNRTNCRSIKTWKSLAVQSWTDHHKDIESPLLIPCPSDDSSSRKCAEHRFVPSTSSDPKVSQQPVHSIWIPQTIRRWSYEFIETYWNILKHY